MKNIFYYSFSIILIYSCNDDFLKKSITSSSTNTGFPINKDLKKIIKIKLE